MKARQNLRKRMNALHRTMLSLPEGSAERVHVSWQWQRLNDRTQAGLTAERLRQLQGAA